MFGTQEVEEYLALIGHGSTKLLEVRNILMKRKRDENSFGVVEGFLSLIQSAALYLILVATFVGFNSQNYCYV